VSVSFKKKKKRGGNHHHLERKAAKAKIKTRSNKIERQERAFPSASSSIFIP
jgi:hypothetical protein